MTITLKKVRIAYANGLYTASRGKDGKGALKYNSAFIFPQTHPAYAAVMAEMKATAITAWGAKGETTLKELLAATRVCLRDGNSKASQEGFAGNWFVTAGNKLRPPTVAADGKTPVTEADGIIYSGCYVNIAMSIWAQDNDHGKRLNGELQAVQFAGPGESWTGGGAVVDPTTVFDDISGDFEDDDIPL